MLECIVRRRKNGDERMEEGRREEAIDEIRQGISEGREDILWQAYELAMEYAWIGDEDMCMEIIALIA